MKFFLDTANLNEIREAASYGLADGVTTNPSLIAKEGDVDFKQHIAAICEIVDGPVSAECTSEDAEGMLREGREYSSSYSCNRSRPYGRRHRDYAFQGNRSDVQSSVN